MTAQRRSTQRQVRLPDGAVWFHAEYTHGWPFVRQILLQQPLGELAASYLFLSRPEAYLCLYFQLLCFIFKRDVDSSSVQSSSGVKECKLCVNVCPQLWPSKMPSSLSRRRMLMSRRPSTTRRIRRILHGPQWAALVLLGVGAKITKAPLC